MTVTATEMQVLLYPSYYGSAMQFDGTGDYSAVQIVRLRFATEDFILKHGSAQIV